MLKLNNLETEFQGVNVKVLRVWSNFNWHWGERETVFRFSFRLSTFPTSAFLLYLQRLEQKNWIKKRVVNQQQQPSCNRLEFFRALCHVLRAPRRGNKKRRVTSSGWEEIIFSPRCFIEGSVCTRRQIKCTCVKPNCKCMLGLVKR